MTGSTRRVVLLFVSAFWMSLLTCSERDWFSSPAFDMHECHSDRFFYIFSLLKMRKYRTEFLCVVGIVVSFRGLADD